jgi:1,2-phenylacetyl-CoA epoxidase PaaB subunit
MGMWIAYEQSHDEKLDLGLIKAPDEEAALVLAKRKRRWPGTCIGIVRVGAAVLASDDSSPAATPQEPTASMKKPKSSYGRETRRAGKEPRRGSARK